MSSGKLINTSFSNLKTLVFDRKNTSSVWNSLKYEFGHILSAKVVFWYIFRYIFSMEIAKFWGGWILEPIPKNDFFTQNVVKNAYLNEFTTSLRNWSKSLHFCWKLKKMQPLKMTFRSKLEPLSRVMIVLCFAKFQFWKSHWIDGFLKYLNRFFFFKNLERVKMHSIIKKTYDFFVKLIKKSQFLLKNSKKCNLQK